MMTMETMLRELGAASHDFSEEEQAKLLDQGYLLIPNVLDATAVDLLRRRVEQIWEVEGEAAGLEVHQQPGTRRLADLVNKGDVFDRVWMNPRVLAAAWLLFRRPFKLFSLNARDALPGQGEQALHADWGERERDEPCRVVNSVWMLDTFSKVTGATRIVPKSHQLAGKPSDYVADLNLPHADEVLALGGPGTVMVYNAHAWHGGTKNQSHDHRRALHCAYVDRNFAQQTDQRQYLRPETRSRLSEPARYLLDVE